MNGVLSLTNEPKGGANATNAVMSITEIMDAVRALPPDERAQLRALLDAETEAAMKREKIAQARRKVAELAAAQGVAPISNVDELRGDFWDEDASAEDFDAWLSAVRDEPEK